MFLFVVVFAWRNSIFPNVPVYHGCSNHVSYVGQPHVFCFVTVLSPKVQAPGNSTRQPAVSICCCPKAANLHPPQPQFPHRQVPRERGALAANTILKNINLSFYPGAKIGVVGLNGSGKSTLLRIMAGEDKEFEGPSGPAPPAGLEACPEPLLLRLPLRSQLQPSFHFLTKLEAEKSWRKTASANYVHLGIRHSSR